MNTSEALLLLQNISVTDILYTCIILEFEIFIVNWQTNKLVYQYACCQQKILAIFVSLNAYKRILNIFFHFDF